mmetsp:Transcript_17250/g.67122  ORF Transcript_17250/g.67122 Transcript_17250/m.67122 type:complete len:340 (+) Transcript_17250:1-1020(+)
MRPEAALLYVMATATVWCSAVRSSMPLQPDNDHKDREDEDDEREHIQWIDQRAALLFPFTASISLLLMYYWFALMSWVMAFACLLTASTGLVFTFASMLDYFPSLSKPLNDATCPCVKSMSVATALVSLLSLMIVITWLFTSNWVLNNVLGIGVCVTAISFVRVPNLKVVTVLLLGLFVYDIFWVFYSSDIFGENVMVEVATKQAVNPVKHIADQFYIPVVDVLDMPVKLVSGKMMLGLGDIVVPGLLVSFAIRYDVMRKRSAKEGYFLHAFLGYCAGLLVTMFVVLALHIAQPALLYLVPGTLCPVVIAAWKKGELSHCWAQGTGTMGDAPFEPVIPV